MAFSNFSTNKILHGTEGRCLIDSEVVCAINSCEAKISLSYDSLNINGSYMTKHRYISGEITGSINVHKHDSWMLQTMAMTPTTGVVPSFTIEFTITDPQTSESQHVALYGCQFSEIAAGGFENAALLSEDWAFTAESYEIIDTID